MLAVVAPEAAELLTDPAVTDWHMPDAIGFVAKYVVPLSVIPVADVTNHDGPRSRSVRVTLPPAGTTSGLGFGTMPPKFIFPPDASVIVPAA